MPFGAEVRDDGAVRFRLWAPAAANVELSLEEPGNESLLTMTRTGDGWFDLATGRARRAPVRLRALPRRDRSVIAVAPHRFARLVGNDTPLPLGEVVWADTRIEALPGYRCTNVLTGETPPCTEHDGKPWFPTGEVLRAFPAGLLPCVKNGSPSRCNI